MSPGNVNMRRDSGNEQESESRWITLSGPDSVWVGQFQLTKHPFYLSECNTSPEAVPVRPRP